MTVTMSARRSNILQYLLSRYPYVVIAALSLVTLTWFRTSEVISVWDTTLPLSPRTLGVFLYTWHADVSTGISDPGLQIVPYQAMFALANFMGLSTGITERLVFACMMALSGVTMYNFSIGRIGSRGAALVSALVYMFNLYSVIYIWREFLLSVFTYALLPLLLTLLHKILFQRPIRASTLAAFLGVSLFATIQGPPLVALLVLGLYAVGSVLLSHGRRLAVFVRLALISVLWTTANLWWVLPYLATARNVVVRYGSAGFLSALEFNSQWSTAFNVLRLEGSSVLYGQPGAPSSYSWSQLYQSSPNIILVASLLFPLLASAGLLAKRLPKPHIFAAVLLILSVAIVSGTQPPFGAAYRLLFNSTPYLLIARDPYLQVGGALVFAYALLIGYFFKGMWALRIGRLARIGVNVVCVLFLVGLLLIHPWPMWTGDVIPPAGRHNVPSYYQQAADWLNSQPPDFRLLSLPMQDNTLQSYQMEGSTYYGQDILRLLTGRSIISDFQGLPDQERLQRSLYDSFYDNSTYFPRMLDVLSVRFIVFHADINEGFHIQFSANKTWIILSQMPGLQITKEFGPLKFFENTAWTPRVYSSSKAIVASSDRPLGDTSLDISNWTLRQGTAFTSSKDDSVIEFDSAATYGYGYIQSPLNFSLTPQEKSYLLITFWSEGPASILVNAEGNLRCCFMVGSNPPTEAYFGNHYYSAVPYTIVYDLGSMGTLINTVRIFATNAKDTSYKGPARLHLVSVSIAGAVGLPSDFRYLFAKNLFVPGSDTLVNGDPLQFAGALSGGPTLLQSERVNPTKYEIQVQSSSPFLIILGDQFDTSWKLVLDGREIPLHVMVNGFANGWYVSAAGAYHGEISFTPQELAVLGILGPASVAVFLILFSLASNPQQVMRTRNLAKRVSRLVTNKLRRVSRLGSCEYLVKYSES